MGVSCYQAGDLRQSFAVTMNLNRAGFTESRAVLLARFVEFWCQKNCFGLWSVEQDSLSLQVSFETPNDVVLFMISEEYGYFVPSATIRSNLNLSINKAFIVLDWSSDRPI